jgi:hypothetical protein
MRRAETYTYRRRSSRSEDQGETQGSLASQRFAGKIRDAWRKSVESILVTGKLLLEAKESLPHGEFQHLDLPFGSRTKQMLMRIAEHPVLSNPKFISHLPPSWSALHFLATIPEQALEGQIEEGSVTPDTTCAEAKATADEVQKGGLYRFERVPEALRTLMDFMEKWPDAAGLAPYLYDDERGVSLELMQKLPGWIKSLYAATRKVSLEHDLEPWPQR